MVSDLFVYQLVLLALVWLCLMLHYAWPSDRTAAYHRPPKSVLLGPPGAIGEKFTVSQHGHEDVSHEQRPLYMEKQWVVLYRIPCTYGCIVVLRCTISTCDRDLKPLYVLDKEVVVANRKFSGVCAWRAIPGVAPPWTSRVVVCSRACMVISPIRWALLLRFPTYEG